MTNIAEEIKKKIEEKKLKPKPRVWFVIKHVLLLAGAVVSLIFISLALSLSWEILEDQEIWALRRKIFLMVEAIPYFWIGIAVIVGVLGYLDLKKTKRGYKVRLWKVLGGMALVCLFLASIFYFVGVAEKAEERLEKRMKGYHKVVPFSEHHWMQPERGLLMGDVLDISEEEIELEDLEENYWIVIIEEDTRFGKKGKPEKGHRIKVLGEEEEEEFRFKAEFVK